jgi:hypothetical protein
VFQMVWYLRHGLITEEIPDPPTNKGLILIFLYQFNQVVVIKSEEITNISSEFNGNTLQSANPFFNS